MQLSTLGWNEFFEAHFQAHDEDSLRPARVARHHRNRWDLYTEQGSLSAVISGRMHNEATAPSDFPAVGDWVAAALRPDEGTATIHNLLPRRSCFLRRAANYGGPTEEQVLAANIDTVFLVTGLDQDFSVRRLERYLTLAWDSGARPVVVLNKADLCDDVDGVVTDVERSSLGAPVYAVSASAGTGIEQLLRHLPEGSTAALLGSSGVGKTTIINCLLGESRLKTGAVRESDGKGRHTTTGRELILLPGGGLVIDTPGMRELQLWGDEDIVDRSFGDIDAFADKCRFRDCTHDEEPGCAVRAALNSGELARERFESYRKLQRELKFLAMRKEERRAKERAFTKRIRTHFKDRYD